MTTPVPHEDLIVITRVPYGDRDAAFLIEAVQQEYVQRYGSRDDTPIEPAMFDPPTGSFFVGHLDGRPVASGAWRRRTDVEAFGTINAAEVKRMYVVPEVRGRGLARRMLAHLEADARAAGAEVMVLETGVAQPEAIALYESSGYVRIPGFGHYKDYPTNRCFARDLRTDVTPA